MNILVLEDRGSVSFYMEEALTEQGHRVFRAFSVNDAQSYWRTRQIDCITVDLNMSPDGLKPDEVAQTRDGLLTGWVWLRERVYAQDEHMREKTIIYTEYLQALKESVSSDELQEIRLVVKRGSTSAAEQVLMHIKAIARMVQGGG